MSDFVTEIYEFNKLAGLLDQPLDDYREASFIIEEALEGFDLQKLSHFLHSNDQQPKTVARSIVAYCRESQSNMYPTELTNVERLDKAVDAAVFAFGYMFKLGLTPEQVSRAMSIVMAANKQKLTMPRDSFGKLMKNPNFTGPEAKLQLLLEER
ncbi:MAG: hypothetical protein EOM36_02755 [Bacteroidia bacterium]|nr:hypothetical protein [Bacteroidia bacterium]